MLQKRNLEIQRFWPCWERPLGKRGRSARSPCGSSWTFDETKGQGDTSPPTTRNCLVNKLNEGRSRFFPRGSRKGGSPVNTFDFSPVRL